MELSLVRRPTIDGCTFGDMTVDGETYCYTLERLEVQIPTGTYSIEITYSPRFHRPLPLLDAVQGRSDIRIHSGNWPRDTEGCILVGLAVGQDMLCQSRAALDPLVILIQKALDSGDEVELSIS